MRAGPQNEKSSWSGLTGGLKCSNSVKTNFMGAVDVLIVDF